MFEQTITLFKGMADYDGGDIFPPIARGSELWPKRDPLEVVAEYIRTGGTLRGLAIRHANYSLNSSPGISFTVDLKIATEFAKRLDGKSGVVLKLELPKKSVISIEELAKIRDELEEHLNLPDSQIAREHEYVYFGIVPRECVKEILHITTATKS